jgi:DNA polymerase (family 10)
MLQFIDAAADAGAAIEINAHPLRLDLDWRLCQHAKTKGVKVAINPDDHNAAGLRDVLFGVNVARKGWLEPKDVLNTMTVNEISSFLEQRKERAQEILRSQKH